LEDFKDLLAKNELYRIRVSARTADNSTEFYATSAIPAVRL
jgi:hypothetical protein